MEFTIPQFIEKEAKIVGPFTLKQFAFIGVAGGACIYLYFTASLIIFILLSIVLMGAAFAMIFLKIQKTPLPVYIKNFFVFTSKPKIYLWKKKINPPKLFRKKVEKKIKIIEEKPKKESFLKVAEGSKLRELLTYLETK